MDSSTEEEEEEFFESLEDIASSSDAESGRKEKHLLTVPQGAIASASNASHLPFLRYEIWKNSPGSIVERRQRLLSQMGLKVERDDPESTVALIDTATPAGSSLALSSSTSKAENLKPKHGNVDNGDLGVSNRKGAHEGQMAPLATMVRSRSDGTFSRLQNSNGAGDSFLRLVRSGTTSPVLHHGGHERLGDSSSAVLRTGFGGQGHPSSKPPLGGKKGNGNSASTSAGVSSTEGLVARRSQSYWSKFGRFRVTDKNGNSLFDSTGSDGKSFDSTPERSLKNDRLSMGSSEDAENTEDGEVLCRIKDLDSGKEFVVNEVGKDGMWNKLKELETGREITLEEFESSLGLSPIVQEVMRRERAVNDTYVTDIQVDSGSAIQKKKRGWLKAIKGVVRGSGEKGNHSHHGSGSDDKEVLTEKSGRRSGSATDDSQDAPPPATRPVKVHAHKKAAKEFADLHLRQEIQAHQGAIWTMKFSLDGSYLATAGQDRVVRVWEVFEHNGRVRDSPDTSGELNLGPEKLIVDSLPQRHSEVKRNSKNRSGRKNATSRLPKLFMLSENAKCSFKGHTEDILDLSWSPSQSLLSSSMDKTVRLWNVSSRGCLKIFTHNDYVTCIQFHPLDDGHFISGSLDGKVRIWSIQEPQVVDWVDLREMVTAACYTPNGQGAVVGSYKGTCRFYKTSGNKLQLDTTFEVRSSKSKRSQGKKITGFQFIPGNKEKVLITSSDSRIRVYDGTEISSKYKGFRNMKSHISASFSSNGKYIICASEDSRVCIWNYHDSRFDHPGQQKRMSRSYEDFSARHVLVAIPWPGMGSQPTQLNSGERKLSQNTEPSLAHKKEDSSLKTTLVSGGYSLKSESSNHSDLEVVLSCEASSFHGKSASDGTSSSTEKENKKEPGGLGLMDVSRMKWPPSDLQDAGYATCSEEASSHSLPMLGSYLEDCCGGSILSNCVPTQHVGNHGFFSDSRGSATWPEEKLPSLRQNSKHKAVDFNVNPMINDDVEEGVDGKDVSATASAWGLVIVTAGLGGEIRTFQNYSLPVRL